MDGELGVCTILTAAHVVKKEGERVLRTEQDQKLWDVATVEIFPSSIDLALVTFQPGAGKCNYPALKMGNSESLRIGSSIFIYGFSSRGGEPVTQFVDGKISALKNLARGYGVSYKTLTGVYLLLFFGSLNFTLLMLIFLGGVCGYCFLVG